MKTLLLLLCFPLLVFAQPQPLQFQLQPEAFPVQIGDWQPFCPWAGGWDASTPELCGLDTDGDLDFFSGSQATYYWFFKNDGTSSLADFEYITFCFDSLFPVIIGNAYESAIHFGDLDGDGDKDAVISKGIPELSVNLGNAQQWDFSGLLDTLRDQYGGFLFAAFFDLVDIDADGDLDIIGGFQSASDHGLRYYENVSTPGNVHFNLISTAWQGIQIPESHQNPCLADLDGDNDLDLLVGTAQGNIRYYRNDGTPTNPQMTLVSANYLGLDVGASASPELADIDGDGDLDLFVGRSPVGGQPVIQGDVYFLRNDGTPQTPNFQQVTTNYLTWDCGGSSIPRLVDIDGDGDPDLISTVGGDHLNLYRNQGSPNNPDFVFETEFFGGINLTAISPWFADLDGDGDLDLLAGTGAIPGPPGLYYYRNQGTPQNPNFVLSSTNLVPGVFTTNSVWLSPWTGDIDGDGDLDLFVCSLDGLYFFRNIGTSTHFQFQYVTNDWQGLFDSTWAEYACFWDVDGDMDLDLFIDDVVFYNAWDLDLRFYRNVGTPQNAVMQLESADLFPELMIEYAVPFVTDIDQDGDGDLFIGDVWGGIRFFRNITGESPVPPDPKYHPRPQRQISILPNPGNSGATISYVLSHPQHVNLSVYNLLGSRLATLVDGLQQPGGYMAAWDAKDHASGIYLVRFKTPEFTTTQKVVITK